MKSNKLLIYIIIILILSNLFFIFKYNNISNRKYNNIDSIVRVDSFIQVDTLYYPKPYPVKVEVRDTIYIPIDSIKTEGDSILLPRETKTYEDSTYRAVVSGFKPFLDTLIVYPRTIYITKEKTLEIEKKDWFNWGLQLGTGYGLVHRKLDVYMGIGCQINF